VHAIWIINLFLYLVIARWIFYRWRNQQPWTFLLFVLISPTILYLASLLLFPAKAMSIAPLITKRIIMRTIVRSFPLRLFSPVDIVDSLLKGVPHFLGLGPIYFFSNLLYFAGLVTAAITRNERYHEFYTVFFLVQTIVISFLIFQTLV
jgi:hypothetical protein